METRKLTPKTDQKVAPEKTKAELGTEIHAKKAPELNLRPVNTDAEFERFLGQFTSYETLKSFHYGQETMKLERMEDLMRDLGNPHLATRAVHIAGTKGKGSTCLILESLLSAGGHSVGAYLSPHVEFLRERIRVHGHPIAEKVLCATLNGILPVLERRHALGARHFPTFFELMTALSMAQFDHERVDYAIYEVGLGGRLDATNVVRPCLTAITSIGLEHTEKLGDSLAAIAGEKAGIVKQGIPCVLGPSLAPEARDVITEKARSCNAPLVSVSPERVRFDHGATPLERCLVIEPQGWRIPCGPLHGPGLRDDLAIALTLWEGTLETQGVTPRRETVISAVESLERHPLPGRVELVQGSPLVILDGAHTEESIASLRKAVTELAVPSPRTLLLSVASDKRAEAILETLEGIATEIFFTRCDTVRSLDPCFLRDKREELGGDSSTRVHVVESPLEAFRAARALGHPVIVTGSLYLAGAIRREVVQ